MPTIAAILFIVAYNMCQWRTFLQLVKTAPKSDILVLVVTFVLTVLFDLVVAIEIGMILACLLFIKRMSEETKAESWVYTDDDTVAVNENLRKLPAEIRVYEVSGPLFFGASDAIEHIVVEESVYRKDRRLYIHRRKVPGTAYESRSCTGQHSNECPDCTYKDLRKQGRDHCILPCK